MKISHQVLINRIMSKLNKVHARPSSKASYTKVLHKILNSNNDVHSQLHKVLSSITPESKSANKAKIVLKTHKINKLVIKHSNTLNKLTGFTNDKLE